MSHKNLVLFFATPCFFGSSEFWEGGFRRSERFSRTLDLVRLGFLSSNKLFDSRVNWRSSKVDVGILQHHIGLRLRWSWHVAGNEFLGPSAAAVSFSWRSGACRWSPGCGSAELPAAVGLPAAVIKGNALACLCCRPCGSARHETLCSCVL